MKVGLYVASQWQPGTDLGPQIGNLVEQVRLARDSGFESLWTAHHLLVAPMQMFQALPLLARLAAEAEGMTVGPAIYLLPMANPVALAEDVATLDWITGGRFVLAVGMGYRPEEFEAVRARPTERVGRMVEGIELIRRLWREERVTHKSRYWQVTDAGLSLKPKQAGGPPIWIGGSAAPAIRRAARLGDGWIASFSATVSDLAETISLCREERQATGAPPFAEWPLCREVYVGADNRTALAEARPALLYKYQAYASWGNERVSTEAFERDFDRFCQDRFIIGDESRVLDEIQRYRDIGFDHFIMRAQWPGLDQQTTLKSIERLGRVISRLR